MIQGDVLDQEVLGEAIGRATQVSQLGLWVNNAAIDQPTNLHEPNPSLVRAILATNLDAYIWGSSAAIRIFRQQQSGGVLVSISSIHGRFAYSSAMA